MLGFPDERTVLSPYLEFLHEVLSHSPHARPFSIDIHRNCGGETCYLDPANCHKGSLEAVSVEPVVKEEREDEPMEDVCESF